MKIVERHEPYPANPEQARESFEWMINHEITFIQNAKKQFPNYTLDGIASSYMRNIGRSSMYGTPTYVYNYIYYTNQLIRAWFTYTMNDGKPVTVQIADRQIETTGKFSKSGISISQVLIGIRAATLLRDQDALKFYASIPLEFTEKAGTMEDILTEIMFFFYQTLIEGSQKPAEATQAYKELESLLNWDEYRKYIDRKFSEADYRYMFPARAKAVSDLFLPVLRIYHAVLSNNQDQYEQAVYEALLRWKEYYQQNYTDERGQEQDYTTEPGGFIATPVLAACAFAYDRGMKLETVSSDYIPEWIIKGEFTGLELLVKD